MKTYKCDNCSKEIDPNRMMTIGINGTSDSFLYVNNLLPDSTIKILNNFSELNYCSKDCVLLHLLGEDRKIIKESRPDFSKDDLPF